MSEDLKTSEAIKEPQSTELNTTSEPQAKQEEVPQMSKEKIERILKATRLTINRNVLEALIGVPYEYFKNNNENLSNFNKVLKEASDNPNKRKVSLKIKEFGPFVEDTIKLMFRFQGMIIATQQDIEAEGYSKQTNFVPDTNKATEDK